MEFERYLKEVFGPDIVLETCHFVENIPLFLERNFEFYSATIQNLELTFLICKNENYNFKELEKYIEFLEANFTSNPVLVVQYIRSERRNWLIQHKIAFIDVNRQMYIPYLGLQIEELKTYLPTRLSFSPIAQLTYIYLLMKKQEIISVKDLSKLLSIPLMSASRALRELFSFHLVQVVGENTRKFYQCISWELFWEKGREFLINPVLKTYYLKTLPANIPVYLSNESALSYKTMISSKHEFYAISRKNSELLDRELLIDESIIDLNDYIAIEIWKYDPGMLSSSNLVDRISLYAQLKKTNDPRIKIELDTILKEIDLCMD